MPATVVSITWPSDLHPRIGGGEQATDLLARSFHDQPHFVDLFPDPAVRTRALPHVFAALLTDARRHGRVAVATREDLLVGVAVWYPPWAYPLTPRRQLAALPAIARLAAAAPRRLRRVMQFQSTAAALHPDQPYWYLAAVGVDPAHQSAGVGTRLLRCGLDQVDATGQASYLETHTPRLVAWYQELGFRTRSEAPFTPKGPPNWTMLRPPAAPTHDQKAASAPQSQP